MTRRITIGLCSFAALFAFATPGFAQQDPTEIGGGKKPYILMIIDSSGSMEYTDDGDNRFPIYDCGADHLCPGMLGYPGPDAGELDGIGDGFYGAPGTPDTLAQKNGAREWFPGNAMEITEATAADSPGFEGFGTCLLWEPKTANGVCVDGDYMRPAWRVQPGSGHSLAAVPSSWWTAGRGFDPNADSNFVDDTRERWNAPAVNALGEPVAHLRLNDYTQPRHVTIKEVLTGDMVLLPNDPIDQSANAYNPHDNGPGCFFVPRQRDASIQPVADQTYCNAATSFEQYPDYNEPLPHFQEYWDVQYTNGAMDVLGTSAIFAVAAFDSYREKMNWAGFNAVMDDEMDGSSPLSGLDPAIRSSFRQEDSGDCDGDLTADDDCYNLGIWQVVGPKDIEIPATLLPELSAYTQIVVNDTGYLSPEEDDEWTLFVDEKKSQTNAFLGATFSPSFKKYADDVPLGKQPIARATPIAAAFHDVYQFFANGQSGTHPIDDDAFRECRPKHVVLLTDGAPAPERDPANPNGRSDTLNEAFEYDLTLYSYDTAEQEIWRLVADEENAVWPDNGADPTDLDKYNVRVHIVGLSVAGNTAAVTKMARMALAGNSCASALVPDRVPNTHTYQIFDENGNMTTAPGTCIPGTGCLVNQGLPAFPWTHPSSGDVYNCEFPALILDNNAPEVLAAATSTFLSSIVDTSGLSSRTRLVVANRLDDVTVPGGGQYRVYSGVRVGGGSAWWQGVLNRTTVRCDALPVPELSLDQEVGRQVTLAPNPADRRRVWTAIPDSTRWCFNGSGACATPGLPNPVASANTLFPFSYDLTQSTRDEFQGTYIDVASLNPALLVNTRVPFEHDPIRDAVNAAAAVAPYAEFNVADQAGMQDVINIYRGRIPERVSAARGGNLPLALGLYESDRVIGGILNSNPLVVGPPQLDLPIESYRSFRAKHADRASMLYVSSMDGLLHALHLGRLDDRVNARAMTPENTIPVPDIKGNASTQREAWAYVPWMIHKDLAAFTNAQAYLMDGTPVAKDVRLCNADPSFNQNKQACRSVCSGGTCTTVPPSEQWRTVLVQGRGMAGAGYYAMDITRPGGLQMQFDAAGAGTLGVFNPDPILLWEFDSNWEQAQVNYLMDMEPSRVSSGVNPDASFYNNAECGNSVDAFWRSSLMGMSISEPEIGTVIVASGGARLQRPVAVFGGGSNDFDNSECGGAGSGMAIYVVDLQTGSLLRRFTSFEDSAGNEVSFMTSTPNRFVGSPVLFDSSAGAVATRGFIGDDGGRLFKIDLLNPDPRQWKASLFFDPIAPANPTHQTALETAYTNAGHTGAPVWGPAAFKPAVALNANRDVMVVYGTGETGDVVTNNQAQAVIALTEDRADPAFGVLSWAEVFQPGEKLTGAPVVFNSDVYFPTYALPDGDVCEPGLARIWGLRLADLDAAGIATTGIYEGNPQLNTSPLPDGIAVDTADWKWWGPEEPALVRGLTITLGELCSLDNIGTDNPTFSTGDKPKPQLVAQTSGPVDNALRNRDESATPVGFNALDRVVLDIEPPQSQTIPLSWTLLF